MNRSKPISEWSLGWLNARIRHAQRGVTAATINLERAARSGAAPASVEALENALDVANGHLGELLMEQARRSDGIRELYEIDYTKCDTCGAAATVGLLIGFRTTGFYCAEHGAVALAASPALQRQHSEPVSPSKETER